MSNSDWICPTCDQKYSQACYKNHVQTCKALSRYIMDGTKCKICKKKTATLPNLFVHIRRMHKHVIDEPTENKFVCTICDYRTSYNSHFHRHQMFCRLAIEYSTRDFTCKLCRKKFQNRKSVGIHLKSAHDELFALPDRKVNLEELDATKDDAEIKCLTCHEMIQKEESVDHTVLCNKALKHVDKNICKLCQTRFKTKAVALKHVKKYHAEILTKETEAKQRALRASRRSSTEDAKKKTKEQKNAYEKCQNCSLWAFKDKHLEQCSKYGKFASCKGKAFQCLICYLNFEKKDKLWAHLRIHLKNRYEMMIKTKTNCPMCEAPCWTMDEFEKHTDKCVKFAEFLDGSTCTDCQITFGLRAEAFRHAHIEHDESSERLHVTFEKLEDTFGNANEKSKIVEEISDDEKENKIQPCKICHEKLHVMYHDRHLKKCSLYFNFVKIDKSAEIFKCLICGSSSTTKGNLMTHMENKHKSDVKKKIAKNLVKDEEIMKITHVSTVIVSTPKSKRRMTKLPEIKINTPQKDIEILEISSGDDDSELFKPKRIYQQLAGSEPSELTHFFKCQICAKRYGTFVDARKHVEMFHKIPIDIQKTNIMGLITTHQMRF